MLCFPASDSGDRHPGTGDRHRPEQVIVFAGIRTRPIRSRASAVVEAVENAVKSHVWFSKVYS
jgi:hypothetical protein